jgi:hypothetical protein
VRREGSGAPGRGVLLVVAFAALLAAAWMTYRAGIAATGGCDCAGGAWQALLWAPAAALTALAALALAVRAARRP